MKKTDSTYQEIKRRICHNIYSPGQKLPGEITLAEELNVSRVTLRTALKQLISEGLVESFGRSGNYVSQYCSGKRFLLVTGSNTEQLSIPEQYLSSYLRNELANAGHQLELISARAIDYLEADELEAMLRESGIAGIFLAALYCKEDRKALSLFNSLDLPVIKLLDASEKMLYRFPKVSGASQACFMGGVRYLASLGHKRICTIFAHNSTRGIALDTYREFLRWNKLADDDSLILHLDSDQVYPEVRKQLLGPEPPTAFMCFCDARAMHVYTAVRSLDMRIPAQISIMGMSGYSERLFAIPKLAMANFHYDFICARAVELMLSSEEWQDSEKENIYIEVPFTIEPNGSCAPPAAVAHEQKTVTKDSGKIFPAFPVSNNVFS